MRRAFHIVYTLLALNFIVPVLVYIFAPERAIGSFEEVGSLLGAGAYPHTEDSIVWRVLGIANVATLGFCCVLLQIDLRRYYPVLVPLLFLKSAASLGFLIAFVVEPYPAYLAASLFDGITVAAMAFFAIKAHRTLVTSEVG